MYLRRISKNCRLSSSSDGRIKARPLNSFAEESAVTKPFYGAAVLLNLERSHNAELSSEVTKTQTEA